MQLKKKKKKAALQSLSQVLINCLPLPSPREQNSEEKPWWHHVQPPRAEEHRRVNVFLPFIETLERLETQKLPVIQAEGLQLQHFPALLLPRPWSAAGF